MKRRSVALLVAGCFARHAGPAGGEAATLNGS
jgi:hypothetical protein